MPNNLTQLNVAPTDPSSKFSTLQLEVRGQVAHLRFTRPELANRIDEVAHVELVEALTAVADDESVRVLVISAEGKIFSAGGDFDEIIAAGQSRDIRRRMERDAKLVFDTLVDMRIPVIAAVQGAAAGMGATVMTLCDIVVAYRDAKISDPHVVVGLAAGDGGIIGWTQSIGLNLAKRFLLTGDSMLAEEAYSAGLVTDLVDTPDEVLQRAEEIAQKIVALPRGGVEGTKRAFSRLTKQIAATAYDVGMAYEMETMASSEPAEAIARLRKK